MKVSVIVPVYNEAESIPELVAVFDRASWDAPELRALAGGAGYTGARLKPDGLLVPPEQLPHAGASDEFDRRVDALEDR